MSGVIAFFLGGSTLELVREQLHLLCGVQPPGSEGAGSWNCSDGIGYLGIGGTLGIMWITLVLAGSLLALTIRRDRPARLALVLLAALSTAWILGVTWHGSMTLVQDEYAPMTGAAYWGQAIGPAALISAVGMAIALLSLAPAGRLSRAGGIVASVLLVVATILQPGLSLNLVPAVGLLAAAVVRGLTAENRNSPARLS
ncbi:hypothetical protein [Microbacterium phyllosphaerae]|uniref:hypothetical protein n=1 Tax=Microbacterium phyllosphaerae TaxID=124798 RepID=UPI003D65F29C